MKALNEQEASILESLHNKRVPKMVAFVPQFKGVVERDGQSFIRMQDICLSFRKPYVIDLKMGLRTYVEALASNTQRRPDLYEKAVKLKEHGANVHLTQEDKEKGITKCMFMQMRDANSTTGSLGFRIQGAKAGGEALGHRYGQHTIVDCYEHLRFFFKDASPVQRQAILQRLHDLYDTAIDSVWFGNHEFIGSSILIIYDGADPNKAGSWMIDFGQTRPAPNPLKHTTKWEMGNHEDGYLFGLAQLITTLKNVFAMDIALDPKDWSYRAEGVYPLAFGVVGLAFVCVQT